MEIDVTAFVQSFDMFDFAHSEAEHCGVPGTAGQDTWKAALDLATRAHAALLGAPIGYGADMAADDIILGFCALVTPATRDEIEDWIGEFGAWSREEIEGWDDAHLCALVFQCIAGDARRMVDAAEGDCGAFDRAAYEAYMENNGGNLWCEDPTDADAKWTLYVGI